MDKQIDRHADMHLKAVLKAKARDQRVARSNSAAALTPTMHAPRLQAS
jgi:hypothetical protein